MEVLMRSHLHQTQTCLQTSSIMAAVVCEAKCDCRTNSQYRIQESGFDRALE